MSERKKKSLRIGHGRPGPGRPKGMPNKLTRTIREAFEHAFHRLQRDPKSRLTCWARANPTEFYRLAAKLIPSQLQLEGKLTLEQLIEQAAQTSDDDPSGE